MQENAKSDNNNSSLCQKYSFGERKCRFRDIAIFAFLHKNAWIANTEFWEPSGFPAIATYKTRIFSKSPYGPILKI